ncbi:hypothetical protein CRUP_029110 [Coryphaenoides rupestris]|nr:hypothetical protein CRUP_029110 [Coryphaenoides rupestris]
MPGLVWWTACLLLLFTCGSAALKEKIKIKPVRLSRGWGDRITWVQTYEEGLSMMKESMKPLIVIHHKEECPFSQDPLMKVRVDLTGPYSNRLFAYEPADISYLVKNMKKAKILLRDEL